MSGLPASMRYVAARGAGGPEVLELDTMAALAEALTESNLPFTVDLVDAALLSPAFRARIAAAWVPLT